MRSSSSCVRRYPDRGRGSRRRRGRVAAAAAGRGFWCAGARAIWGGRRRTAAARASPHPRRRRRRRTGRGAAVDCTEAWPPRHRPPWAACCAGSPSSAEAWRGPRRPWTSTWTWTSRRTRTLAPRASAPAPHGASTTHGPQASRGSVPLPLLRVRSCRPARRGARRRRCAYTRRRAGSRPRTTTTTTTCPASARLAPSRSVIVSAPGGWDKLAAR